MGNTRWLSLFSGAIAMLVIIAAVPALIALAVSHAMKCPYCIDAYTTQCLETGANPEQMMEAVHVAAVMQAGITLVHSVQMQNHLEKLVL